MYEDYEVSEDEGRMESTSLQIRSTAIIYSGAGDTNS